jgi:hypothetical protein
LQCLDDEDGLQWIPYSGYIEQQHELDKRFAQEMEMRLTGASEIKEADDFSKPRQKKWAKKLAILEYEDEKGIRKALPPTKTLRWLIYVDKDASNESKCWASNESKCWAKIFRRRFQISCKEYKEMVEKIKD